MEDKQGVLDEMSGDHSGSNQETDATEDHGFHLPVYLAYLSLGFKVITTVIIVLMAVGLLLQSKLQEVYRQFITSLLLT